jgi:hypothetical protein
MIVFAPRAPSPLGSPVSTRNRPSSKSIAANYDFDGDTNGIFYLLGTNFRTGTWVNPATVGRLPITFNPGVNGGVGSADARELVDRTTTRIDLTNTSATPYFIFDLGYGRALLMNKFSYRWRADGDVAFVPKSWTVAGSNDATNWTTLLTVTNATPVSGGWKTDTVPAFASYRYFRFQQTATANASQFFTAGEVEIYGLFTYTEDIPPRPPYEATYASDGDANGVIYYLGTQSRTASFANPQSFSVNPLAVTASGVLGGSEDPITALTDRNTGHFYTTNVANSWVKFDFGDRKLLVKAYSYRSRTGFTGDFPTQWKLEGSSDNTNWTVIDGPQSVSITTQNQWLTTAVAGQQVAYRYLKWTQTAANSSPGGSNPNSFVFGEAEFYGTFSY